MSKNLAIRWNHPKAIKVKARYARIDNTTTPVWSTVAPDPVSSPAIIATNVPNGQYKIEVTPVYADGRPCETKALITDGCPGLLSLDARIEGSALIVSYAAPEAVPSVLITVNLPNGGKKTAIRTNDGTDISFALQNLDGDYSVYGQGVCDASSGFYSLPTTQVYVTRSSAPSLTQSSTSVNATIRTQIFTVGDSVAAGNVFTLETYSHPVSVVAALGDTPGTIAVKLRDAINNTVDAAWRDHNSAPPNGTAGYKPTATASGKQVIVVLNAGNAFAADARIS